MSELHLKYAPILRYNKDEQFFPMRVDDMIGFSELYVKDEETPVIPRGEVSLDDLTRIGRSPESFLRSVKAGPILGHDVVSAWSEGALEMVYRWAGKQTTSLAENLVRKAYSWFTPKNKSATQLFWWNGLVSHVLEGVIETATHNELPRLILPSETRNNALEQYQSTYRRSPGSTYYFREVKDRGYLCLQYWFFYSYNDWGRSFAGMNDHEGDWESMMLFFELDRLGRPQEPPAYVTYADHESRQTKPWGDEDVTLVGDHPMGYVAAGSHATYPEPGTQLLMSLYNLIDYATGDGATIDHDEWVHRINLDDVRWLGDFNGSWGTRYWLKMDQAKSLLELALSAIPFGNLISMTVPSEIELPGVSAPHGPVGNHRPQYATPAEWAGVV